VEDYRWSGYRGMFCQGKAPEGIRKAWTLTRREKEACFHTHDSLDGVPWLVNSEGGLEPASACDHEYLESAFGYDQAFFLKTIGSVNPSEMRHRLEDVFSGRLTDSEFYKEVNTLCQRWFQKELSLLSLTEKIRLLPYVYRTRRTTIPQLARCFSLPRDSIAKYLGKRP
jgi:hypothetical protein